MSVFTFNLICAADAASFNVNLKVQTQSEVLRHEMSDGRGAKVWQQRDWGGMLRPELKI